MMIVSVWPKGYADQAGPKTFEIEDVNTDRQEVARIAREKFGMSALIFNLFCPPPAEENPVREIFTEEYIRMMSRDS